MPVTTDPNPPRPGSDKRPLWPVGTSRPGPNAWLLARDAPRPALPPNGVTRETSTPAIPRKPESSSADTRNAHLRTDPRPTSVVHDKIPVEPSSANAPSPPAVSQPSNESPNHQFTQISHTHSKPDSPPPSSFNTSISSLPPPSQTSTTSSSKRVFKNGVEIVRTSDSEEESDDELEDLGTLLAKTRKRPAPDSNQSAVKSQKTGSNHDMRTRGRRGQGASSFLPPPPKYKHSLASLVERAHSHTEATRRITETKAKLKEAEEKDKEEKEAGPTKEIVASALDGSEDGRKLLNALLRTEVLETKAVWHFFGAKASENSTRNDPFPRQELSKSWHSPLKDVTTREFTLLSDILHSKIAMEPLPDAIVSWIFNEMCFSPRTDLTKAYMQIVALQPSQLRRLLSSEKIVELFRLLGAKEEATRLGDTLTPLEQSSRDKKIPPPVRLQWVLKLLRNYATIMTGPARKTALLSVLRLSIDDNVHEYGNLQEFVLYTTSILIASIPDDRAESTLITISKSLYNTIKHPVLQQYLITSLPYQTTRESLFQRKLALAFFLETPNLLSKPLTQSKLMIAVLMRLQKPDFKFGPTTNFAIITARFTLLSTALDAGFSTLSFMPLAAKSNSDTASRDAARAEQTAFDQAVDTLAMAVRRIMAQIRGSGTASLRMSEAKQAMERLVYRLDAAVRTRDRSAGDVFAGPAGPGAAAQTELMAKWMGTAGPAAVTGPSPSSGAGGACDAV
ncbi:uncharacterized protein K452DRAFT_127589 [Aplosporella prunicola CBS 121167]|uniref:Uncharacterized protein n=1 Tax=Aplosporella prunicola CBS 121167 TaxID=1176127 RepID=A0A6A6AXD3_9PEZI|nr:uncharacterized protein K452DRAFT_127589 [Aplosporella prunicola CBS 121167]KAF2136622.1 hypothetical protein K452DRAFT_127589 [Aplosporella prunicola CBS 121167]